MKNVLETIHKRQIGAILGKKTMGRRWQGLTLYLLVWFEVFYHVYVLILD